MAFWRRYGKCAVSAELGLVRRETSGPSAHSRILNTPTKKKKKKSGFN